jgi:lipooligosaccharide transport system permease protein
MVWDITVNGRTVGYANFVAPGLLAAAAMNGAIAETTTRVFAKVRYTGLHQSVLSSPITPTEFAAAEIAWAIVRGTLYATGFLLAMAILGLIGRFGFGGGVIVG